eukprot:m.69511 g.69511  ORF g.69511 m.69511 type:complete len:188 (+) comp16781_c0_seq3:133-696(+)
MKRLLGSEEAIEVFFFKLADVTFAAGQAQRPRNEATNFRAPKMTATTELNRQAVSVTLTYFLLYTCFLLAQSATSHLLKAEMKKKNQKFVRYYSTEPAMLGMDRAVGNMMEQMPLFLVLFWLCVVFAPAQGSTVILAGYVYIAFRALYPIIWKLQNFRSFVGLSILVSTVPNYLCLVYFVYVLLTMP